jgi:hypothetical protein
MIRLGIQTEITLTFRNDPKDWPLVAPLTRILGVSRIALEWPDSGHGYPGCHRNSLVPEIFGIHWASNGFQRIYSPLDSNGLAFEFE